MTNGNMISDEMFADVIDGVATREVRRLVYKAIEGDEELRQAFNHCMYLKVFEEEIENDFRARHSDIILELKPVDEMPDDATILNQIRLSVNNQANNISYDEKK
jgi:hypothetical protein